MDKVYQVNCNGQQLLLTQQGLDLLFSGERIEVSNPSQVFQGAVTLAETSNAGLEKYHPGVNTTVTNTFSILTSVLPPNHFVTPETELAMPHVVPGDNCQLPQGSQIVPADVNGGNIGAPSTNTDIQDLHDVLQLVVFSPDGVQRTVLLDHQSPVSRKTVAHYITQVCRQFGINEEMDGVCEGIFEDDKEKECPPSPVKISEEKRKEKNHKEKSLNAGVDSEELPLFITGKLALCDYCGFTSPDFSRCLRCHRKFTRHVKTVIDGDKKEVVKQIVTRSHEEKKRCNRKNKKPEETETVTILSSDEEENCISEDKKREIEISKSISDKEPVITELTVGPDQSYSTMAGGGRDMSELLDSPDVENILLECRTVRIGSYKVVPLENVLLSTYGLRIRVPSLKGEPTTIKILRNEIVKVLVHFGAELPVMFYYVTVSAARKVRNFLNMTPNNSSQFFDPTSSEEYHKRITLLPISICEESRLFIKSIYENKGLIGELDLGEADQILVRAANKKDGSQPVKKSLTQSTNSVSSPSCQIQTIMIYPPPPMKGGISINTEDYACLGEDQFLNDVIIDFYLKYLVQNVLSEEDRKRTHVLSSFFYKRLTSKTTMSGAKQLDGSNLTAAEKRHARVKGWTKGVNIFSKDFIIIPINESSHWFLAIICFPGLQNVCRMSDNEAIDDTGRRSGNSKAPPLTTIGETTITVVSSGGTQPSPVTTTITVESDGEERDEADGNDDDLEPNTESDEESKEGDSNGDLMDEATPRMPKNTTAKPTYPAQEAIKQPCILVFDSLLGASRSRVIATLREYLHVEYKVKHKGACRDFSKNCVKGAVPKVPQQTNFTDCGLYVLQYVEEFFKNPLSDYRMPLKIQDWFNPEIVSRKRYEIQQLLHKLMDDQGVDRENLPRLDLRPDGGRYSDDEEDEGVDDGMDEEMGEEEELGEEEEEGEEPMEEGEEEEEQPPVEKRVILPPMKGVTAVAVQSPRPIRPSGGALLPSPRVTPPRPQQPRPVSLPPRLAVRPSVMIEPRSNTPPKRTLPSSDSVTIQKKPVTTPSPLRPPLLRAPRPPSSLPRISSSVEIVKKKVRTD